MSSISEKDYTGKRLLIVDDEKTIRTLFKMVIGNAMNGIDLQLCENGEEAVKAFEEKAPDLILMDLHMPIMDGFEAFFKIRDICKNTDQEMPGIVFCTGYSPSPEIRRIVDENDKHCLLSKPVGPEQLIAALLDRL